MKHKRALVRTLFTRAHKICTFDMFEPELHKITQTLTENGYLNASLTESMETPVLVPKKHIYLEISFKGDLDTQKTTQRLVASLKRTYNTAELRVISRTQPLSLPSLKGSKPIIAQSHCIYQFSCNCGACYIGINDRRFRSRIKGHVPKWVENTVKLSNVGTLRARKPPASSIAKRLLETGHQVDKHSSFRILLCHSNPRFLRFAEAVVIKRSNPLLCVQKQISVHLRLPWA